MSLISYFYIAINFNMQIIVNTNSDVKTNFKLPSSIFDSEFINQFIYIYSKNCFKGNLLFEQIRENSSTFLIRSYKSVPSYTSFGIHYSLPSRNKA